MTGAVTAGSRERGLDGCGVKDWTDMGPLRQTIRQFSGGGSERKPYGRRGCHAKHALRWQADRRTHVYQSFTLPSPCGTLYVTHWSPYLYKEALV